MKQIEVAGQTFGVAVTWGAKLDFQERLGEFWQEVKREDPPMAVAVAGVQQIQTQYLASVLREVDGKAVVDATETVRGLDAETVEALFAELGIGEKRDARAEGNAEPDFTEPPAPGSEESP